MSGYRTSRPSDHVDSEEVTSPDIGFRGWLRWFWRQLTSMRTALFLLLLLAAAAIPGSIYPSARPTQTVLFSSSRTNPSLPSGSIHSSSSTFTPPSGSRRSTSCYFSRSSVALCHEALFTRKRCSRRQRRPQRLSRGLERRQSSRVRRALSTPLLTRSRLRGIE